MIECDINCSSEVMLCGHNGRQQKKPQLYEQVKKKTSSSSTFLAIELGRLWARLEVSASILQECSGNYRDIEDLVLT